MTNIDTQIIFDKNGNPIPQYLDVSDKSGGTAGTMKPITGQNGSQNTQVTGSNVVHVEMVEPTEIRENNTFNFSWFDLSEFKSYEILVSSTLDVPIWLTLDLGPSVAILDDYRVLAYNTQGGLTSTQHLIVPNQSLGDTRGGLVPLYFYSLARGIPADKDFYKYLPRRKDGMGRIVLRSVPGIPTSGSITVVLMGVK